MTVRSFISIIWLLSVTAIAAFAQTAVQIKPGRDPKVAVDEEYTKKIREYTTETFFNSPLTDYLPASSKVPTPKAVLGDVAGAPGILPYSHEVYRCHGCSNLPARASKSIQSARPKRGAR